MLSWKLYLIITSGLSWSVDGVMHCDSNCKNPVTFPITDSNLESIKEEADTLIYHLFQKTLTVNIPIRRVKSAIWKSVFSDTLEYSRDARIDPEEQEYRKWVSGGGCYIGQLCPPGGDCWGSDSKICHSNVIDTSSLQKPERLFQWSELHWSAMLSSTCTQDWECYITTLKVPVYPKIVKESARACIYVKNRELCLANAEDKCYNHAGELVCVLEDPLINSGIGKAECFAMGLRTSCSMVIDKHQFFPTFEKEQHSIYLNGLFILNKPATLPFKQLFLGNDMHSPASIDDIRALEKDFHYIVNVLAFNQQLSLRMVASIQELIVGLVYNVAKYNPNLLSDILQIPVMNHVNNDGLNICPCVDKYPNSHCTFNKSIAGIQPKCESMRSGKSINIFETSNISHFDLVDVDFRGTGEDFYEKEIEKTEMRNNLSYPGSTESKNGYFNGLNILSDVSNQIFVYVGAVGGWIFIGCFIAKLILKLGL